MSVIIAVIILSIYLVCPIIGKCALLLANTILPDPVPFVDEFIMWIGLFAHLSRLMRIADFVRTHKKAVTISAISILVLAVLLLILLL